MGRVIQIVTKYSDGTMGRLSTKYDFIGNPIVVQEQYWIGSEAGSNCKKSIYSYDKRGKLLSSKIVVNNHELNEVIYIYDDFGNLIGKSVDSSSNIAEIRDYDILGQTTGINVADSNNNSIYNVVYRYNNPQKDGSTPYYTGKISEYTYSLGSAISSPKTISLDYDHLGRITDTRLYESGNTPLLKSVEKDMSYDRNGNILTLKRYGNSSMDNNLSYTYSGNQLLSVSDSQSNTNGSYTYDLNGNMISDGRNNLELTYNIHNLLSTITDSNGDLLNKYTYLSGGSKLKAENSNGEGLIYRGSFVYRYDSDGNEYLESIESDNGRIIAFNTSDGLEFLDYYFVKDNVNSVRAIVNVSPSADDNDNIVEQNDYTVFGTKVNNGSFAQLHNNRYRFNGKEEQFNFGSSHQYIDYGARMYDSSIARWFNPDPLAEKYFSMSPYVFSANNPVNYFDPDGMDIWEVDSEGNIVNRITDETQDMVKVVEKMDDKWTAVEGQSISFEYGTITAVREPTWELSSGENIELTMFEVNGDLNASHLFEVLANPSVSTNVEWTHAKIGFPNSERNVVGTSHSRKSTAVGGYLLAYEYTLREVNHNHPSLISTPSKGDIKNAKYYIKAHPNVKLQIYTDWYYPYNATGSIK